MGVTFDLTVTLGVVVHLLVLVIAISRYAGKLEQRLELTEAQLKARIQQSEAACEVNMQRLHGENTRRISVIEDKVGDLWEWFLGRRSPKDPA